VVAGAARTVVAADRQPGERRPLGVVQPDARPAHRPPRERACALKITKKEDGEIIYLGTE